MKSSRSLEIKVGIVSLLGIILFIVGVSIGKGFNVNTGEPEIRFIFPSSGGIDNSAPVVVNGVERGKVTSIKNMDGKVEIRARIDNYNDFHADADAKISILEITGGKKIQINPGSQGKFDINKPIIGKTPPDIPDLVMILGEVSSDAVSLIRNLDTTLIATNKLLDDDDFINNLKYTASNINQATNKLNIFLDDNYYKLESTVHDLAIISSELKSTILNNEPKVSQLIDDIDSTIADADKLLNNTNSAIDDLRDISNDIKNISNAVKDGDGFANKLIYDKNFANTLDSAMIKIDKLVKVINQHGVNVNVRLGTRP